MTSDQIQTISDFARSIGQLNKAKLNLEYLVQLINAKGLAPDAQGKLPDIITLNESGQIEGSDLDPADYVLAMAGIGKIVETLESALGGTTVENALLRFSR